MAREKSFTLMELAMKGSFEMMNGMAMVGLTILTVNFIKEIFWRGSFQAKASTTGSIKNSQASGSNQR